MLWVLADEIFFFSKVWSKNLVDVEGYLIYELVWKLENSSQSRAKNQ